jgi:hypothetical protein
MAKRKPKTTTATLFYDPAFDAMVKQMLEECDKFAKQFASEADFAALAALFPPLPPEGIAQLCPDFSKLYQL